MINIDNLEKFVMEALADGEKFSVRKEGWIEILTRLLQAEKDAARYRWLRNCDTAKTEKLVENGHIVGFGVLDAMIDEAMQCSK